jgi:methyl-accepting chemotaxis protein-2 (aspartate sensor receptor)
MENIDCNFHKVKKLYCKFTDILNVDKFTRETGAIATVFQKTGQNFVRISTTLRKENGELAIGTLLDPQSSAYKHLIQGECFIGDAVLFGKQYCSKYAPFITHGHNKVIIALGVGLEISD